jgi:hypothetical protein
VEYYIKNTSNILMQIPVSSTLGMTVTPYQNVGRMENKGLEMILRYNDKFGDVKFFSSLSATKVNNEIKNLGGAEEIINGNLIWRVGESYNALYGLETEGIYQSDAEIREHLIFEKDGVALNPYIGMTPYPGDIRFKDRNNDGVIDASDKTIIGQTFPDWTFSGSFSAEWRGFDLTVFLQGVQGLNALNQGIITIPFHVGEANTGVWYKDGWTPDNPSTTIQRVSSEPNRAETVSEYYLEDVSYLRVKNLDLGYTLPPKLFAGKGSFNVRIRLYASCQNLLTFTKMRYGFDPEKPTSYTNTMQYPQTRIYSVGANVKF